MTKPARLNLRWRKLNVRAEGIPALATLAILSVCAVGALILTHSAGCPLLHVCK